jgi:hypothetical protein
VEVSLIMISAIIEASRFSNFFSSSSILCPLLKVTRFLLPSSCIAENYEKLHLLVYAKPRILAGSPVELIMKISGHKRIKDFCKYIKTALEQASQKMKEIWQRADHKKSPGHPELS